MLFNSMLVTITICLFSILSCNAYKYLNTNSYFSLGGSVSFGIGIGSHSPTYRQVCYSKTRRCYDKVFDESCYNDNECDPDERCIGGKCIDACITQSCDVNTQYPAADNHKCVCRHKPGYELCPKSIRCLVPNQYPQCDSNKDCTDQEQCRKGTCVNACKDISCGINGKCVVRYRNPLCICDKKYEWNDIPKTCVKSIPCPTCYGANDCPDNHGCFNNECINLCDFRNCGDNARCIGSQNGTRCECLPGYIRDIFNNKCVKRNYDECFKHDHCDDDEICVQGRCKDICKLQTCSTKSNCIAKNDLFRCIPSNILDGINRAWNSLDSHNNDKCVKHDHCDDDEICIQGRCKDICKIQPCKKKLKCIAKHHVSQCVDPQDTETVAKIVKKSECKRDADCPTYQMCHKNKCIDACDHSSLPSTNTGMECATVEHKCVCECLPGFNGNPYNHGCKKIYSVPHCDNHKECADDQICAEGKCVNACGSKSLCGPNTTCIAKNNFGICKCEPGLTGDPYGRGCSKPVHGCWNSQDCRDNETCLNGKCSLGCDEQPPCGYNTMCETIDHIRECKCYPGYEGDAYGDGCTICAVNN